MYGILVYSHPADGEADGLEEAGRSVLAPSSPLRRFLSNNLVMITFEIDILCKAVFKSSEHTPEKPGLLYKLLVINILIR